jgi:hypothetical protein
MDIQTTNYGLCILEKGNYSNNGNLALGLVHECGEPICNISTNIIPLVSETEFCANINNINETLWNDIIASGLFQPTGDTVQSGFCEYPIYKLVETA